MKRSTTLFAPLALGAIFFACTPPCVTASAEKAKLPANVRIDGVEVGGLHYVAAKERVRERLIAETPVLTVETPETTYRFRYPEVCFSDDLESLLPKIKRAGEYAACVQYSLCGLEACAELIAANARKTVWNAEASFSADGFSYTTERTGRSADEVGLIEDIRASLSGAIEEKAGERRFVPIRLKTEKITPERTLSQVKKDTVRLTSFTTWFSSEDRGRCENIRLAAQKIDGATLPAGGEFSFNRTVGARTRERGFSLAKIISGGEFVEGVGGGVCQVSTTIYNAALLSGMEIVEQRAHSLAVAYVPPSRDAMVSSLSDFRFRNPHPFPVYLAVKVRENSVAAIVYGRDEGFSYAVVSEKLALLPPPEPKIDENAPPREGRAGLKSVAYLETYRFGKLVDRKKLRSDTYAPLCGITGKSDG